MSPRRNQNLVPWPVAVDLATWTKAEAAEYKRLLDLIRAGELEPDPTLIVFSSDGLLQFARADLIPFFYCPAERVEDLLRWWYLEGFPEDLL